MTAQNLIDLEPTLTQMIRSIEDGLPISHFKKLQDSLDLPDKDLAKYIRIPKSTLALRKKRGKFSFEESERLLRLQRLFEKALDVFKNADLAKKWLKEDAYGLGDIPPLEYAATEIGAREVEDLLGRIEHGVFS
jgi:putative toxin-antitoxin system antitoxin component (TIGR02293 family)